MFARYRIALCALAVMVGIAALAEPSVDGNLIPSVLAYRDNPSFWVAAECAVGKDGKLKVEALGGYGPSVAASVARQKEDRRRNPQASGSLSEWPELEGCEIFSTSLSDHFQPTSRFAELVEHADVIVSGRVIAMRQGFLGGIAGSLLLLSTDSLKGDSAPQTYLFYPLARIQTSEGLICAKPLGSFVPPAVGDRFLVFSMLGPNQLGDRMMFAADTMRELVHEPRNGSLHLPVALASLTQPAARRFDEVVDAVRKAIGTSHP